MLFIVCLISLFDNLGMSQNFGGWIILDSTKERRALPASTILSNGNFLIAGGDSLGRIGSIFSSCEIYDTLHKTWRFTGSMNKKRSWFRMILLNNNKVLAIGGVTDSAYFTSSCEIFDPVTETWSFTDSMIVLRIGTGYTITTLKNSNVLITGGYNWNEGALNKCEIYNINTNQWSAIDTLRVKRDQHTATLLKDGRVLIAGGGRGGGNNLGFCEIYDPVKDSFYLVRQMNIPRHQHSAVLLPDGRVLVSGGRNDYIDWLRSIEVYDPQKNLWFLVDSLILPRTNHYSIILNDSLILFGGGSHNSETWEIYDYKNFKPLYIDYLPVIKGGHQLHQLNNGKVVSLGGWDLFYIGGQLWMEPSRQVLIYDPLITFVEKYESKQVKSFELYQNYPNPFNPTTTIKFSLPEKTNTKISVYNLLGQKVKELLNEIRDAGIHTINFDGNGLPSGIYFYKIEAGKYTDTKKMILMK